VSSAVVALGWVGTGVALAISPPARDSNRGAQGSCRYTALNR